MSIRVAIRHTTTYKYDRLVSLSPHLFRLRPAVHSRTPIQAYSFKIEPSNHFINWQQDPFGNYQARVVFPEKTKEMKVDVEVIADMVVFNPFDFFLEKYAETFPFSYPEHIKKELLPYLEITESDPLLLNFIANLDTKPMGMVDYLVYLNQQIYNHLQYTIRMEPGVQTSEETLYKKIGSCRDFAWLFVQVLRHKGLAARFVSGYLVQLTADIKSLDGPSGPEKDFTDLHAWTEVYIPGAGWVGLDATSGLFAGEGHIPLACTPHYTSAAPVVGALDFCETEFEFDNSVIRIHEDPRVTKPYSEIEWDTIVATGFRVEDDLQTMGVKMTMGGEPTFVSIDDMESPQWNSEADGKEKRELSHDLIFKLRESFGPQGMIHYGQGKWYPGEPLPRWQYALYWRKDGEPIWKDINYIAHEKIEANYTAEHAKLFLEELTRCLAIPTENVTPVYEDLFYFLWTENKTPVNINPKDYNLKDGHERKTLADLLDTGLGDPTGYLIPLRWNYENQQWKSVKWNVRRKEIFLLPGNSPIGLRLPLNTLPEVPEEYEPYPVERSPFEELESLGNPENKIEARYGNVIEHPEVKPRNIYETTEEEEAEVTTKGPLLPKVKETEKKAAPTEFVEVIKTAICVEARDGIIYLFLPPTDYLEHYLDIIASIERTAVKLNIPVRIEGYEPPRDYRLQKLVVSPDPGVIEVNIHPSKNWKELLYNMDTLYEQARLARLGTEKFMLDGKHTGTGGGNHVTIGGEKPSDSPLLRRPDLLRSLITYWQHHPGLSYLFSGMFIGPTSQAPRVDEGRDDRLFEIEIAFSQVPDPGEKEIPFWLVDRIFRNLLTDITGNTHRSEFCIDKLYSPDSSSGRLGILEFRAFDMPPHKHMCMVQILLIRALIAKFWKQPYKHDLVRWGTHLHDKYLLPHYVYEDLKEVVQDLNDEGYGFKMSWFDPFFEFRFPVHGRVMYQNIDLEVRSAIEPWHVLGEEMSNSGTARFVDSSLERVQVKLKNINEARYILTCNGVKVPLQPTMVKGEFVCGIRYRAWNPPSALHPTISVDVPLVFDIVDVWNGKSIGGCTYHVSHPGGRSYSSFPVNSYEAESRRESRFFASGHTQDVMIGNNKPMTSHTQRYLHTDEERHYVDLVQIPTPGVDDEYPNTLDLRKMKKNKY
ncbi:MAG: transglutaminase family protein [Cytophagaceae bacterium]